MLFILNLYIINSFEIIKPNLPTLNWLLKLSTTARPSVGFCFLLLKYLYTIYIHVKTKLILHTYLCFLLITLLDTYFSFKIPSDEQTLRSKTTWGTKLLLKIIWSHHHCVESVKIRRFFCSVFGHFSCIASFLVRLVPANFGNPRVM